MTGIGINEASKVQDVEKIVSHKSFHIQKCYQRKERLNSYLVNRFNLLVNGLNSFICGHRIMENVDIPWKNSQKLNTI